MLDMNYVMTPNILTILHWHSRSLSHIMISISWYLKKNSPFLLTAGYLFLMYYCTMAATARESIYQPTKQSFPFQLMVSRLSCHVVTKEEKKAKRDTK